MSTSYDWLPAAPDDAAWWDSSTTRDAALHRLRLQSGDIDDTRVSALIPAAGYLINDFLDRCDAAPGPPPNPVLQEALIIVTVNLYGKDPANGTSTSDFAAMSVGTLGDVDPLGTVRSMLMPFKERFGVA
jgi:hypothetical protein